MALTFDCVLVAAGREPSGFTVFIRHSPDGLRLSANKVSAIWLKPAIRYARYIRFLDGGADKSLSN